jgi:glutathione peroxidase
MTTFFNFKLTSLDGSPDLLAKARGKVVLAVNVASKCGLTPQYTGLEQLQKDLASKDFTVLGFPCNQFGGQEPGTPQDIQKFCSTTYGVSFPLSEKIDVNGAGRHPVYQFLTGAPAVAGGDIQWNFEKFLISREGTVLKRYPPTVKPEDKGLMQDIADAL